MTAYLRILLVTAFSWAMAVAAQAFKRVRAALEIEQSEVGRAVESVCRVDRAPAPWRATPATSARRATRN